MMSIKILMRIENVSRNDKSNEAELNSKFYSTYRKEINVRPVMSLAAFEHSVKKLLSKVIY